VERRIGQMVVFQKWRWTEITVTLGLIFIASLRKEWLMTFIAVRCPHCQSDQIIKRGKTARGTQRYLCQNTLCTKPTVSPLLIPPVYCYINGFQRVSGVEKPWLGGAKRRGGRAVHPVAW
jgi:hypothetical protein